MYFFIQTFKANVIERPIKPGEMLPFAFTAKIQAKKMRILAKNSI